MLFCSAFHLPPVRKLRTIWSASPARRRVLSLSGSVALRSCIWTGQLRVLAGWYCPISPRWSTNWPPGEQGSSNGESNPNMGGNRNGQWWRARHHDAWVLPSAFRCTHRRPSYPRDHAGEDCLEPRFRDRARHLSGARVNYRSVYGRGLGLRAESACHSVGELSDLSHAVVLAGALHPIRGKAVSRCASAVISDADYGHGARRPATCDLDPVAGGTARHVGLAPHRFARDLSDLFPPVQSAAPVRRLRSAAS